MLRGDDPTACRTQIDEAEFLCRDVEELHAKLLRQLVLAPASQHQQ
jgi:hypothetical protein